MLICIGLVFDEILNKNKIRDLIDKYYISLDMKNVKEYIGNYSEIDEFLKKNGRSEPYIDESFSPCVKPFFLKHKPSDK
jgi:hypothetical protein